ncbi:MAG: hypothetical protein HOV79_34665 [Hamadaea sp.]|nr:hypothetical protein [Hamadaea sp.]
MSDTHRASLPSLALGSAVLAADALRGAVRQGVRSATEGPVDWATTTVVPKVVEQLMPYLTTTLLPRMLDAATPHIPKLLDSLMPYIEATVLPRLLRAAVPQIEAELMPRLLDAALPLIQQKVMPVIIADLAQSEELRELITEQSRDVVADAAGDLRESTASADDRVESGFRKLFHLSPAR